MCLKYLTLIVALSGCAAKTDQIRLYVFDVGQITAKDGYLLGLDSGRSVVLGNTCFLVVHPKGNLLWDTGLSDSLINYPEGIQEPLAMMRHSRSLMSQLREIDISPAQINYLALSHMHNDHTGNANAFNDAVVIIQRSE